jgi:ppGpp synthetase/RelA/SpoT-type nucleotidyltranferase
LFDKLRRTPEIGLGYVRDVAGVRIVGDFTLREQDAVARHLIDSLDPQAKVIDRRATPQSGYRAVHVIVASHGAFVEIQIRTELQALWAEAYERLADTLGRRIRYGELPSSTHPDQSALIQTLQEMSTESIADIEHLQQHVDDALKGDTPLPEIVTLGSATVRLDEPADEIQRGMDAARARIQGTLQRLFIHLEEGGAQE